MLKDNLGVLVIDLQPAYALSSTSSISRYLMRDVLAFLQAQPEDVRIVVVYVNEELSGDTQEDVRGFWAEHGASNELLERCDWVEKSYAFARGWMDNGVSHDDIVEVLRRMRSLRLTDSRDFEAGQLEALSAEGSALLDPLFLEPDLEQLLPRLRERSWQTCGGGRDECLREVELVLQSANVSYERLDTLTY